LLVASGSINRAFCVCVRQRIWRARLRHRYSQNGTLNVVTQASLSGGDLLPAGTNTITLIIHSTGVTPVKIDALARMPKCRVNVSWTAVSDSRISLQRLSPRVGFDD